MASSQWNDWAAESEDELCRKREKERGEWLLGGKRNWGGGRWGWWGASPHLGPLLLDLGGGLILGLVLGTSSRTSSGGAAVIWRLHDAEEEEGCYCSGEGGALQPLHPLGHQPNQGSFEFAMLSKTDVDAWLLKIEFFFKQIRHIALKPIFIGAAFSTFIRSFDWETMCWLLIFPTCEMLSLCKVYL